MSLASTLPGTTHYGAPRPWTDAERLDLARMRRVRWSMTRIAAHLERTVLDVTREARELGVPTGHLRRRA